VRGLADELREQARVWAESSCAAQGRAVAITDPGVLSRVAGLLGAPSGRQAAGGPSMRAQASGSPDRFESARVEAVETFATGGDDDMVEHGFDDRVLPG
jgi:hypothetical protein